METSVTVSSTVERVYELGLAEHKEKVSLWQAFYSWPRVVYNYGKRNSDQGSVGECFFGTFILSFIISVFPFLFFVGEIMPRTGYDLLWWADLMVFLGMLWTTPSLIFYANRSLSHSERITPLEAHKLLLAHYRRRSNKFRDELVGEEGKLTKRANQLDAHAEEVKSIKARVHKLAEQTSISARKDEMHAYEDELQHQLDVISEARGVLDEKREAALEWLRLVDSEVTRVNSVVNEEEEYSEIRRAVKKVSGKTSELVRASMQDLWGTLQPLEDHLAGVSSFLMTADQKLLVSSRMKELPSELKLEDSVHYAEAVVELTREDVKKRLAITS